MNFVKAASLNSFGFPGIILKVSFRQLDMAIIKAVSLAKIVLGFMT